MNGFNFLGGLPYDLLSGELCSQCRVLPPRLARTSPQPSTPIGAALSLPTQGSCPKHRLCPTWWQRYWGAADPWTRVLFSNTGAHGQIYLNNNPIISFLGAFPIPKLFPPKNIIEERLGINVILLCFKCENRSVILCLVSKPSIGV